MIVKTRKDHNFYYFQTIVLIMLFIVLETMPKDTSSRVQMVKPGTPVVSNALMKMTSVRMENSRGTIVMVTVVMGVMVTETVNPT